MFNQAYLDAFAILGIDLSAEDRCSVTEIEGVEAQLGVRIPRSLNDYFLLSGRETVINQTHNRLLPPERWFIDSGHLVFMEENQCVVFWGVGETLKSIVDAPVFQGVNSRKRGIEWHLEHDSCSTFLRVMANWNASFGGAISNTAVGYVQEAAARKTLDEHWQFVGEVNGMRSYTQPGRAICFLKWEDLIQERRKLPPWRVYAAAASVTELEQIRDSLPAQWENWGA